MPSNLLLKVVLPLTVISAISYQWLLRDLLFVTLGVGRTLQLVADFPYSCHRLQDPRLHACEDLWLSEASRQLFLACSDSEARREWMPK